MIHYNASDILSSIFYKMSDALYWSGRCAVWGQAQIAHQIFFRLRRRAFMQTQKLERLMAAAPNMGGSSIPK